MTDFDNTPLFLGPMAGNGDYAFRRICKECGADYTVTEMVSAKAVYYHDKKTEHIAKIWPSDRPCFLQVFGSDPVCMDYAVKALEEEYHPEGFDINMGCPAPKIFNNGDGSALLKDLKKAEAVLRAVRGATALPVSVKFRLGVELDHFVGIDAAKCFEAAGADFVTVHGRYRDQHYSGSADWDKIAEIKSAIRIPLIANGDVTDVDSYNRILRQTGADGVMIARAALGDPHLFTRIKACKTDGTLLPLPTPRQKFELALQQLDYAIEDKGEALAVREMRKHFLWYVRGLRNAGIYKTRCCKVVTKEDCIELLNTILSEIEEY